MPTYCHSCPYNKKYCQSFYVDDPTCPHGYSPLQRSDSDKIDYTLGEPDSLARSGKHVLKPEILIKIGKTAANRDEYQTAKECYEKILEIEPANNEAAFLLKRLNYILEDIEEKSDDEQDESELKPAAEGKTSGFLSQQEEKRISIKPKQQFDLDPNIIDKEQKKIYHVEQENDGEVLEKVSRNVARQIRKQNKASTRNMGLAAGIICILMIIILLWYFGYLKI